MKATVGMIAIIVIVSLPVLCRAQFAGGNGTEDDPWQIATAEHLDNIRSFVGEQHSDKYFVQTADIDLRVPPWNEGAGWVPIGNHIEYPFFGNYDGNFFEIRNLTIDLAQAVGNSGFGLFGGTEGAILQRIHLENVQIIGDVYSSRFAGGLVGWAEETDMIDCSVGGIVAGHQGVGGLAGVINNNCNVIRCRTYGFVEPSTLRRETEYFGGITGALQERSTVTDSYSTMKVSGYHLVGGLVGLNHLSTITRSYAGGAVCSQGDDAAVGGLVGGSNGGNVTGSFWNERISGQSHSPGGGSSQPITQMLSRGLYENSNWDFDETWSISEGASFPYLSYEEQAEGHNIPGPYELISVIDNEQLSVSLDWDMHGNPQYYNIYRNGIIIDTVNHPNTAYLDDNVLPIVNHRYYITAVYTENDEEMITPASNNGFAELEVSFTSGSGTAADPYHVDSAASLSLIRRHLNAHFVQTADINLGVPPWNEGAGWTPISREFGGLYDGNGYTIYGMTIDDTRINSSHQGLFAKVNNATLRNIALKDVNIRGQYSVGGIVGEAMGSTTIERSFVTGKIYTERYGGGLVGDFSRIPREGQIVDCYTSVKIMSENRYAVIGGIAGNSSSTSLARCLAVGPIHSLVQHTGAITGINYGDVIIANNYWNIETTFAETGGHHDIGDGNTTRQLMQRDTFAGFDFDEVWRIEEGESYPFLQVEGEEAGSHNRPVRLPPVDVTAQAGVDYVDISWNAPNEEMGIPCGYNIYRDNNMINDELITNREYRDTGLETFSVYNYQVSAVYGEEESILSRISTAKTHRFAGGTGSEDDPYLIETASQLSGINIIGDGHYLQIADIDLAVPPWNEGSGWTPLNLSSGSYDGNGYRIRNLYINNSRERNIGLFGQLESNIEDAVTIRNVGLENISIRAGRGNLHVGGLAGQITGTTIKKSYVTGNIRGYAFLGGIAGYIVGFSGRRESVIENCYSSVNITPVELRAAGIGGIFGYTNMAYPTIANCYVNGYLAHLDRNLHSIYGVYAIGPYTAFNSYWNAETTGIKYSWGVKGNTALEMMQQETFEGWDFDEIWAVGYNGEDTYPYLQWQERPSQYNFPVIPPTTVSYTDAANRVQIEWHPPSVGEPDEYRLYREGNLIAAFDTETYEYTDEGLENYRPFSYYMTSIEDGVESYPSNTADVTPVSFAFAGGKGTLEEPYQVRFGTQLSNIRYNLHSHYRQTRNINLFDVDNWTPLSSFGEYRHTRFTGSFDGNGKVISNLTSEHRQSSGVSLFGSLNGCHGGFLKNITLKDVDIIGERRVGALAGASRLMPISNCHVSGSIKTAVTTSTSTAGGLVGCFGGYIKNSSSSADVRGGYSVGGLVGRAEGEIENSYATGDVYGRRREVGGFVGSNIAVITNCYSTGNVEGTQRGGGFVGWDFVRPGNVIDCYWDVQTSSQDHSEGGYGRTTEEMTYPHADNTFVNWDFDDIWLEDKSGRLNNGYPVLWSQYEHHDHPDIAVNPQPEYLAEDVPVDLERLFWQYFSSPFYEDPVGFRVYFSTEDSFDEDDFSWIPYSEDENDYYCSELLPPKLAYGSVYYWKVVPTQTDPGKRAADYTDKTDELNNKTVRQDGRNTSGLLTTYHSQLKTHHSQLTTHNSPLTTHNYNRGDAPDVPVWVFNTETETDIDSDEIQPYITKLHSNYPNPFNPETTIHFSLAEAGEVSLTIFNIRGEKVIRLIDNHLEPGNHTALWDGTNRAGNRVSSGVYLYHFRAEDSQEIKEETRKMMLLK